MQLFTSFFLKRLNASSPALEGTWIAPEVGTFFTTVAYRDAFSATDNWMAIWTNFTTGPTVY